MSLSRIQHTRCLLFVFSLLIANAAFASSQKQVAVATAHPESTKAGIEILKRGGNAFDAAAAITASLAVVEPYGSGIGGGGFWLIHRASDNKTVMIDGREKAPGLSTKDMYLDESGNVVKGLSVNGPMAAGIPGTVAGITHLVEQYGRLELKQVLKPAIKQAKKGFRVTPRYQKLMGFRANVIKQYPEAASIFLHDDEIPGLDELIIQKDLAQTLKTVAEKGRDGFYKGDVALKMVNSVKQHGGIWALADLENYEVVEREPIRFNYHDMQVTSATLPSSGGVVMGQVLQILEHFNLKQLPNIERKHIVIEAMKRGYRDRAAYLGDSDFIDVPIDRLLDKKYTEGMALTIHNDKATPSSELAAINVDNAVGEDTTHFSVMDSEGNIVSATLSINLPFGSGFVAEGTGVVLNNEMDDFSIKPLTANSYGLVGDEANSIAPGKRPLSSMTPTIVEDKDRIAILGTPGGSRIITMVLLGVLDFADGKLPKSWVSVPRYHHQYLPDEVQYELNGLTAAEQQALKAKGHTLKEKNRRYGNMQAIMYWKDKDLKFASSDPRGEGTAEVVNLP